MVGEAQNALQRAFCCGGTNGIIDFLGACGALGNELQVNDRDIRGWHADSAAVQLALQLRQNKANSLGRTR